MPLRLSRFPIKRIVTIAMAGALLVLGGFCGLVWWMVHRALNSAVDTARAANRIPVSTVALRVGPSRFEAVGMPTGFRSAAEFGGDLYVCSRSALFRYRQGDLTQTWRVGAELPAHPLESLVVRTGIGTPELWLATDGAGVVIYDGNTFRQLLPEARAWYLRWRHLPATPTGGAGAAEGAGAASAARWAGADGDCEGGAIRE